MHKIAFNTKLYSGAEISFIFYIVSLYIFGLNEQYLFLSELIFIAFAAFSIFKLIKEGKFYFQIYFWLAYLFIIYHIITYFWAKNPNITFVKLKTLLQLFVLFIFVYHSFYKDKNIEIILKSFYIAGLALCVYSIFLYGPNKIIEAMIIGKRLGGDIGQENAFGMNLAITVVLCLYFWFFKNKKINLVIMIFPFGLAMASGSRKALLIIMLAIVLLIYIKFGLKKFYISLVFIVASIIIVYSIIQLPIFYTVFHRVEGMTAMITGEGRTETSAAYRESFVAHGLEWFKKSPFIGYGLSNFRVLNRNNYGLDLYAHNNYIELLVGGGIIGFVLYYVMYFYILIKLLPMVNNKNSDVVAVFIILLIRLFTDFASVSFDSKMVWVLLALGFLTVKKIMNKTTEGKYYVNT